MWLLFPNLQGTARWRYWWHNKARGDSTLPRYDLSIVRGSIHFWPTDCHWGIKAYILADSKTGYLICLPSWSIVLPQTAMVVMTLAVPFHYQGYNSTSIAFTTAHSLQLSYRRQGSQWLVQSSQTGEACPRKSPLDRRTLCGTLRAARPCDMLALSWIDKHKVLMLSTKHLAVQVRSG